MHKKLAAELIKLGVFTKEQGHKWVAKLDEYKREGLTGVYDLEEKLASDRIKRAKEGRHL